MSNRPTEDQLEDFAETGRHGCLLPDIDVDESDEESNEEGDE